MLRDFSFKLLKWNRPNIIGIFLIIFLILPNIIYATGAGELAIDEMVSVAPVSIPYNATTGTSDVAVLRLKATNTGAADAIPWFNTLSIDLEGTVAYDEITEVRVYKDGGDQNGKWEPGQDIQVDDQAGYQFGVGRSVDIDMDTDLAKVYAGAYIYYFIVLYFEAGIALDVSAGADCTNINWDDERTGGGGPWDYVPTPSNSTTGNLDEYALTMDNISGVAPTDVDQGTLKTAVIMFDLYTGTDTDVSGGGYVKVNGITVSSLFAEGADQYDIGSGCIYIDANADDTFQLSDTIIGSTALTATDTFIPCTDTTITGSATTFFLTIDVDNQAIINGDVGLEIQGPDTQISFADQWPDDAYTQEGIISNSATEPQLGGNTFNIIGPQADALAIDNVAPASIMIDQTTGSTAIAVARLQIQDSNPGVNLLHLNSIEVEYIGSAPDTDVTNIRVYRDTGNREFNFGVDIQVDDDAGYTFTAGYATITLVDPYIVQSPGYSDLFIVYDIANTADTTGTMGANITEIVNDGNVSPYNSGSTPALSVSNAGTGDLDDYTVAFDTCNALNPVEAEQGDQAVGVVEFNLSVADTTVAANGYAIFDGITVQSIFADGGDTDDVVLGRVYLDAGDAGYDSAQDTFLGSAAITGTGTYIGITDTPITTTTTFYLAIDVNWFSVIDHDVGLEITNPSTALTFADPIDDVYTQEGVLTVTDTSPDPNYTFNIIQDVGIDIVPPEVASTNPLNGGIDFGINSNVEVIFSENMDVGTTQAAIHVFIDDGDDTYDAGDTDVTIALPTVNGNTVTIDPDAALAYDTVYSVEIGTTAEDLATPANTLQAVYYFEFTSDKPPEVASTNPADGGVGFGISGNIEIIFSESMDVASTNAAITLEDELSAPVSGVVTTVGNKATFNPDTNLDYNTTYTCEVATSAEDTGGNPLQTLYSFSFTTDTQPSVSSTTPTSGGIGFSPAGNIIINFSKNMEETTTEAAVSLEDSLSNPVSGVASLVGNTLTFNPDINLTYGETYTCTVVATAEDTNGNTLASPYSFDFTIDVRPVVSSTTPSDGANGIAVGANMQVIFSKTMDETTTEAAVSLEDSGSNPVTGVATLVGNTLTFNPDANLTYGETYTCEVAATAEDTAGNTLAALYSFDFTVDVRPVVSNTNPADGGSGVAAGANIQIIFSKNMDDTTTEAAVSLEDSLSNPVSGVASLVGNTLTFNPDANLIYGETYTCTVADTAEDTAGNTLSAPYSFDFTVDVRPVVSSTTPSDGANGIAVGVNIQVIFSKTMDETTTELAVSLEDSGSNPVTGVATLVGNTLTFNPDVNLTYGETYTCTIAATAEDTAGNTLASLYSFDFTVDVRPVVSNTNPSDGAVSVLKTANIQIIFSKNMDETTTELAVSLEDAGSNPVSGVATLVGNTLTFNPDIDLTNGETYTCNVADTAEDTSGNTMPAPYSFDFTVDVRPVVSSTVPIDTGSGVAVDANINIIFSKFMDDTTTELAVSLADSGANPVTGVATLVGNTLTFNPDANLDYGETYTCTVADTAEDTNGNTLASPYSFDFTIDVRPVVSTTNPINGASGVAVDAVIEIIFSKVMEETTTEAAVSLEDSGSNPISGVASLVQGTLTFTPDSDLINAETYTCTIAATAQDNSGNTLASLYSFDFTVDVRPVVSSTNPSDAAIGVLKGANISVIFSKNMDETTTEAAVSLEDSGSNPVAGVASLVGNTLTFNPNADLTNAETYTCTVANTAEDIAGNTLASPYSFDFTVDVKPVVSSTNPSDGAIGVAVNSNISVIFSKNMDDTTTEAAVSLEDSGSNPVAGVASLAGNTLTFNPNTDLNHGEIYTCTIADTAQDSAGNTLENPYSFDFTIDVRPIISSRNPTADATGVIPGANVVIIFSKNMDETTTEAAISLEDSGSNPVSGVATLVGNTLTFNPDTDFTFGETYTCTIAASAEDTVGNAMAGPDSFDFTCEERPIVSSTIPVDGASGFTIWDNIIIAFSKTMDETTTEAAISIEDSGSNPVAGVATLVGNKLTFNPNIDLQYGEDYTCTVAVTAEDINGNTLNTPYSFDFTTDVRPIVSSSSPAHQDIGIVTDKVIEVIFSKDMDEATTEAAISLEDSGSNPVSGTAELIDNRLTFTPDTYLTYLETYTCTIANTAEDTIGNSLAVPYSFSFEAGVEPAVDTTTPLDGATDVSINADVVIAFSKEMNPTTYDGAIIVKDSEDNLVAGTITGSTTTATFNPDEPFEYETVYTCEVGTGIEDALGYNITSPLTFSFTTETEYGEFNEPTVRNNMITPGSDEPVVILFKEIEDIGPNGKVSVKVYTSTGKKVATLASNEPQEQLLARLPILWDGVNGKGRKLGPGLYFIQITAKGYKKVLKVLIVR